MKELLALWLLLAVLVMGDLDNLSVVHLQYANSMCVFTFSLLFLAFLLQTFPNNVTKQVMCPTACYQGLWASLP